MFDEFELSQEDRDEARRRALMMAGFGLLGTRKGQEGQGFSRAGLLAMDGYDNSLLGAKRGKMEQFRLRQIQAQMQEEERKRAEAEAAKQAQAAEQARITAAGQDPYAALSQPFAATGQVPKWGPEQALTAQMMAAQGVGDKEKLGKLAAQFAPEFGLDLKPVRRQDGSLGYVQVDKRGGVREASGYEPPPDNQVVPLGDRATIIDKLRAQPGMTMAYGQSPDNRATVGATMRGQNMVDARARDSNAIAAAGAGKWQYDPERGVTVNPVTGESRPVMAGDIPLGAKGASKQREQAESAQSVIDEAKKIIPDATGSLFGTAADNVAGAFGASPKGAEAIAKLQALEARLMLTQPRMEGPQSDRDTLLYKQAAGQIGDPRVPRGRKLAALQVIEAMNKKYLGSRPISGQDDPLGIRNANR